MHRVLGFAAVWFLVAMHLMADESQQPPVPQRPECWDRVACIQTQGDRGAAKGGGVGKLCSAFLVNRDGRLFIVTAGHACVETNRNSRIRYLDPSGKSQWVTFGALFKGSSNPWDRDPISDFAVAEIDPMKGAMTYMNHLTAISFPLDSIGAETPRRTTEVMTVGFPLGIGAKDTISSVVVCGHIASQETPAESPWGEEPIVYCSPALAQGTSGGPTFLNDPSRESQTIVGMYVGIVHDLSGAKLSKMVPARLIRDAITRIVASEKRD